MKEEVKNVTKTYWSTDATTLITGASDPDPVTFATHLIKTEYIGGITLVEELEDFFINSAVTQADYAQTCEKLLYGCAVEPTKLSNATEEVGDRLIVVAGNCAELCKKCCNMLELYINNQVDLMIANLDTQRIIPGSQMTKDELSSGITLVEQFKKMMNNEVVSTADYSATLAKWQRFFS